MTLVSHKHHFVLLRTKKTAGTSLEMALEPLCAPEGHVAHTASEGYAGPEGIIGVRHSSRRDFEPGLWAHSNARFVKRLIGAEVFETYLKIAPVRNPFDKAVSWFFYSQGKKIARHQGKDAATAWRSSLSNAQKVENFRADLAAQAANDNLKPRATKDYKVCHINGACVIDRFLRLEALRADLDAVLAELGITPATVEMGREKIDRRPADDLAISDYYDTPSADLIRHAYGWMFEAGGYSPDPRDAHRASETLVA
ncbi:MAG: sulfotransferase family 2 domain-containing protein [Pseudomonadota bacterium]